MSFTPVDPASWERREQFRYFSKMAPTGYSLTAEIDVTRLRQTQKEAGLRFYPVYLYLVTRELSRDPAFTLAERDGVLGHYDSLTPLYAVFHEDDKTFSLLWTEWRDSFAAFNREYLFDRERYAGVHGILAKKDPLPPPDAYTVSCVPWVSFSSFSVMSYENKPYYFPSVEAGKFTERAGRTFLPLSLTCHHAATDGWHVKSFLERFQSAVNAFDPQKD